MLGLGYVCGGNRITRGFVRFHRPNPAQSSGGNITCMMRLSMYIIYCMAYVTVKKERFSGFSNGDQTLNNLQPAIKIFIIRCVNMTSFSFSSELSDISGISRISRSSSLRFPVRADSLSSIENLGLPNYSQERNKSPTSSCKGHTDLEKINKYMGECEASIAKFAQNKLHYDCVEEVSLNSDKKLSEDAAKKLQEMVEIHEVRKYLYLPNSSRESTEKLELLGSIDFPKIELSDEEKLEIKCTVEAKLREKTHEIISRYESLGGSVKELEKRNQFSSQKQIPESCEIDLLHWRDKIEEACSDYEKELLSYEGCINRWLELKYGELTNMHHKEAESLLVKAQVAEIQAKITRLSCTKKLYKEAPITLEAFRILKTDLDGQISRVKEDIRKKEALKKLYDDLRMTEYDDALKKYSELCNAIEKKRLLMKQI